MRRTLIGVVLMMLSLAAPSAHADTTKITPKITMAAASEPTYDHPTTTVTGTVTGTSADGTTAPLTGQVVQIICYNACTNGNLTTDHNGHFTVPVAAKWWDMSITASISATDTVDSASTVLALQPHSDTRITASLDPNVITAAAPTSTVSGRLEYLGDDSTWKPLPGRTIGISGSGARTSVVSDADGAFTKTVTFTPPAGTAQQVQVSWNPSGYPTIFNDQIFFDYAQQSFGIYSPSKLTITGVSGSMNALGRVSFRGTVNGGSGTGPIPMQIEYSADGATGWKAVANANASADGVLNATFTAVGVPAYYRAVIGAANGYAPVDSDVVKVDRVPTSISGFKASVDAAAYLTVKGTVASGDTEVPVRIQYSANGTSGWKTLSVLQAGGDFSAKLDAPLPTAYYRASIVQGSFYTGSTSSAAKAGRTVTRVTGVKVSPTKVKKGAYFTVTGTLQKQTSGGWKALAKQKVWIVFHFKGNSTLYWYSKPVTGSTGRFTAKIKASKSAYWIPVFYGATGYYASAPSKYTLVTVG